LYAYFRFMLGDDGMALRALSDTVVGAAGEMDRVRDPDESAARIFTLARVEYRRHQHVAEVSADGARTGVGPGPGGRLGLPEIARLAVSRLSSDVREGFVLSAPVGDLSLPVLAKVLGRNLEEAADLRAKAGLDFVRALALCAEEADYTMYSGAEMRRRAEASIARAAEERPPSLPVLDDPALAPFRDRGQEPPAVRDALPMPAPAPVPAVRPTTPATRPAVPAAHPTVPNERPALPDGYPAVAGAQTRRLDGERGHRADDQSYRGYQGDGRGLYDDTAGSRARDYGPPDYGSAGRAFGRMLGERDTSRGARRRKLALVGAAGIAVVAVVAVVVVGVQALTSGGNDTIMLTHGGPPVGSVPNGGSGVTLTPSTTGPSSPAKPEPKGGQSSAAQDPAPAGGGYSAPAYPGTGGGPVPTPATRPSARPNPRPTASKTTKPSANPTTSTKSSSPAAPPTTDTTSPAPISSSPSAG
jgi:hypothetical protein